MRTKESPKSHKSTLPEWVKSGHAAADAGAVDPKDKEWRVPKSWAGPGAAGLALLLVILFFLGWQSGKKSGLAEAGLQHKAELERITRRMVQQGGVAQAPTAAPPVPGAARAADPRDPSLQYWRLCQATSAQAHKYAAFLAAEGRRVLLTAVPRAPAKGTAPEMVAVFVVNRGYRPGGDRVEVEKSRAELLALGDRFAKRYKSGNPFRGLVLEPAGQK